MIPAVRDADLLAGFGDREQIICRGGWGRDGRLVVIHCHSFRDHGHGVDLAVDCYTLDGERRKGVHFARQHAVQRGEQAGADFFAEAVVWSDVHIGAAAGRRFGLELVEQLVEGDFEDRDLCIRELLAGRGDELIDRLFLVVAGVIAVPDRDRPLDSCAA